MKKVKKLVLRKETIAHLTKEDQNEIKGGNNWWTEGCTDGCASLATWLMCTNGACTADCHACVTSAYELTECM